MKKHRLVITWAMFIGFLTIHPPAWTCTNFLITKKASTDGSTMITYAADSHLLYGELYFTPAAEHPAGAMLEVYEWDTGKFLGKIRQPRHTCSVVGNMNEYQVAIGETTFGGKEELQDTTGIIDYGSLIYITLQRAKNAREAIKVMHELVTEYGYYSTGESFSIADKNEVWIMEMIGKGIGNKGAVWVARKIPDGYISGHANHARITTFPLTDGKTSITTNELNKIFNPEVETIYAHDVIAFAKEKKYYEGKDKDFSFSDIYAPINFGGARFCEARVFAGFNRVNSNMEPYLDYAMGKNLKNRMPLWIKPDKKLSVHDVMEMMRDYYQGTPMDMTQDVGAGPYGNIVRWRPLTWKVEDQTYFNERAISTQQTGFSFVAQCREGLPDPIGGILWFGVDDTYTTVYTPVYCGIREVPGSFAEGNGGMMDFSNTSAFWVFNQVSNFAYTRFNEMIKDIQPAQRKLENKYIAYTPAIDKAALELYQKDEELAREFLTEYSCNQGNQTVKEWRELYQFLFAKYVDGNIKEKAEIPEGYKYKNPNMRQPGYGEDWYKKVVNEAGEKFKMEESEGH